MNLVVHFDMPGSADAYLHRSGRAGRFETNGLVVAFVAGGAGGPDAVVLDLIQQRFATAVEPLGAVADVDERRCFLK